MIAYIYISLMDLYIDRSCKIIMLGDNYQNIRIRLQEIHGNRTRWLCVKILSTFFGVSALVSFYTNLSVMCSSIGMISLASYRLLAYKPEIGMHFKFSQTNISERWFIAAMSMLVLNLPWLSILSLIPWLFVAYMYGKRIDSLSLGDYINVVLCFIQWEVIMLRYDEFITIPWGLVVLGLWIPVVIAALMFYQIGIPYLKDEQPLFMKLPTYDDWEQEDTTQQDIKHGKFGTISLISICLLFLTFLLQMYIPESAYQVLLLFTFCLNLVDLAVFLTFKKQIAHYLYPHLYQRYILSRKTRDLGFGLIKQQSNKEKKNRYECLLCEGQAKILHPFCGYMVFCQICFTKNRKHKQNLRNYCPICITFYHSFMKLLQIDEYTDQWVCYLYQSYLYEEQYLLVDI